MRDLMKRILRIILFGMILGVSISYALPKDLEIKGRQLVSKKPPFTLTLPSDFSLFYSYSHKNPEENSLTRVYFLLVPKGRYIDELLILQMADKTNPQAGPMSAPPLQPYTEKRLYSKGRVKQGRLDVDYLIQLMAWDPNAPSLEPLRKRGMMIPSHWALQGQFLFLYLGEHAVYFRYSKDIHNFGVEVSGEVKDWEKGRISGNEKKVYDFFQKRFMEMIQSIQIQP